MDTTENTIPLSNLTPNPMNLVSGTLVPSMSDYISSLEESQKGLLAEQDAISENLLNALMPSGSANIEEMVASEKSNVDKLRGRSSQILGELGALSASQIGMTAGARKGARGTLEQQNFLSSKIGQIAEDTALAKAPLLVEQSILSGQLEGAERILQDTLEIKAQRDNAFLEMAKQNLERNYNMFDDTQKNIVDLRVKEIQREQEKVDKLVEDKKELITTMVQNGAPQSLISKLIGAETMDEILTTPGISAYFQSPLERAQTAKIWAEIGDIGQYPSPGLTVKERQEVIKDPTSQKASGRIGVINAMQAYKQKLIDFKGGQAFDFNLLSPAEKRELESALKTTVGSAINVAQGQGAMGDEEAKRILDNLKPNRLTRSTVIQASVDGVIDAQRNLLDNDLSYLESAYPGVTDSFQNFAEYKTQFMPDEEFFSTNNSYLSTNEYFGGVNFN